MTRCVACDKNLKDFEATRKIVREDGTMEYPDLCNKCYHASGVSSIATVVERNDLRESVDIGEEPEFELDEVTVEMYNDR